MSAQIPKPIGALGALVGLIGFSALAGVLVTAMITPALAVTSMTAKSTVGIFEDLPEYMTIDQQSQRNTLYALQGGVQVPFAQVFSQNREEVTWDNVSQFAKDAAVAGEDQRFFEHGGVDLAGIARAAVNNVTTDTQQGASTITQQLVKNLLIQDALSIDDETKRDAAYQAAIDNSLDRKLKEAKLAIGLEKRYTKQEILLGYLNIAGFGGNTYGIESAAQLYYSTIAKNLTLAQAASLIAIVQQPTYRSPDKPDNWQRNQTRRDAILKNMLVQKKIVQAQYDEAIAVPVNETTVLLQQPSNGCSYASAAKPFCDYVLKNVKNLPALGASEQERRDAWTKGGYDVYTTLDLDQQAVAEADLAKRTPATESRFDLGSAISTVQVGTGRILIMAQNKGFDDTGAGDPATTRALNFNTDQAYGGSSGFAVGSTYKIFTLVEWLKAGHGLRETVDANIKNYRSFSSKCDVEAGGVWAQPGGYTPKNDSGKSQGRMTVLAATTGSVNAAFVNMASKLDLCDIADTAKSMGVHMANGTELGHTPAAILGTNEIAPLTMANAYAVVAGGGMLCQPIAVDKIIGPDGTELVGQPQDCTQAISPEIAAAAAQDLKGPMGSGGTGAGANPRDGTPLIGKTGTAEALQSYMVAASSKASTAVWIGNITGKQNMRRISVGGILASNLRTSVMKPVLASLNASPVLGPGIDFPPAPKSLLVGSSQPVPQLAGQTIGEARKLVRSLGLGFDEGETVASDLPVGRVVSSDPPAGSLVSKGSTVTVSISDGTLAVTMPNVVGQKQKDAAKALTDAGFTANVELTYVESDPKTACTVTASSPEAGAATSKAATVSLTVNGGKLVAGVTPKCP